MLRNSAVLSFSSVHPGVSGDPVMIEIDLNRRAGGPQIHLLSNKAMRHGIVHIVERHVVIVLNRRLLPYRYFIWRDRQWPQQRQFFFQINRTPGAIFLREMVGVVFLQLFTDRFVEGGQGKELLVAQCGNDLGGNITDPGFPQGLIFWPADYSVALDQSVRK